MLWSSASCSLELSSFSPLCSLPPSVPWRAEESFASLVICLSSSLLSASVSHYMYLDCDDVCGRYFKLWSDSLIVLLWLFQNHSLPLHGPHSSFGTLVSFLHWMCDCLHLTDIYYVSIRDKNCWWPLRGKKAQRRKDSGRERNRKRSRATWFNADTVKKIDAKIDRQTDIMHRQI